MHRGSVRVDGDGHRHIAYGEFIDGFHAKIFKRNDPRGFDRFGDQIGSTSDRHQVGRPMLPDRVDPRRPAFSFTNHGNQPGLGEHHLRKLIHACGGRRPGRPDDFIAHRIDRADVVNHAIAKIHARWQSFSTG